MGWRNGFNRRDIAKFSLAGYSRGKAYGPIIPLAYYLLLLREAFGSLDRAAFLQNGFRQQNWQCETPCILRDISLASYATHSIFLSRRNKPRTRLYTLAILIALGKVSELHPPEPGLQGWARLLAIWCCLHEMGSVIDSRHELASTSRRIDWARF